jgi:hypothetical protein
MRGVAHVEGSLIAVADKTEHRDGLSRVFFCDHGLSRVGLVTK